LNDLLRPDLLFLEEDFFRFELLFLEEDLERDLAGDRKFDFLLCRGLLTLRLLGFVFVRPLFEVLRIVFDRPGFECFRIVFFRDVSFLGWIRLSLAALRAASGLCSLGFQFLLAFL